MDTWIHCNKCYTLPSSNGPNFWFTSCGHILCVGCAGQTPSTESSGGLGRRQPCGVCQREAGFMVINRKMRSDVLDLFKPPAMLIQEYMQRVTTAITFQAHHRDRLLKHQLEMYNNVTKRAKIAEKELNKRTDKERILFEEKQRLRHELEQAREHAANLTSTLDMTNRTVNMHMHNTPSSNSMASMGNRRLNNSPAFMAGRNSIRSRPIKPVVCASYSVGRGRSLSSMASNSNRSRNAFISPSASFIHHKSPALMPGRITKGPVLPPSLGIHHRRDD